MPRVCRTFQTKKNAQKWEKKKEAKIENGFLTFNKEKNIEEVGTEYIKHLIKEGKKSSSSIKNFTGYIKNYCVPIFKEAPFET